MASTAVSQAQATWEGNLTEGRGQVRLDSGVAPELPVTWGTRTKREGANTSPEELIAAAHAACFSMALSAGLNKSGKPPRQLIVNASCTFEVDQGAAIKRMLLEVTGDVPGMDEATFREAANAAGEGCPVSKALKGNVEIQVQARLKR